MCHSLSSQFILTTIPSYSQGSWGSWLRAEVAQHLLGVSWSPSEGLTDSDVIHAALSPQYGLPLCSGQCHHCFRCRHRRECHNEEPRFNSKSRSHTSCGPRRVVVPCVRSYDLEHCAREDLALQTEVDL